VATYLEGKGGVYLLDVEAKLAAATELVAGPGYGANAYYKAE
jgi:hypothetical protein